MGFIWMSEDKNYYSVPHRYIGKHVEVQYSSDQVEVYYNHQRLCSHKRSCKAGHYTVNQQHLSSTHQKYSQWNPEYFAQKAIKIGPNTHDYIRQLIDQYSYPELGYKQAMGICQLTRSYPKERLEAACLRGLNASRYSYRTIESILKKGLDQVEMDFSVQYIPEHQNIRGANYYH